MNRAKGNFKSRKNIKQVRRLPTKNGWVSGGRRQSIYGGLYERGFLGRDDLRAFLYGRGIRAFSVS